MEDEFGDEVFIMLVVIMLVVIVGAAFPPGLLHKSVEQHVTFIAAESNCSNVALIVSTSFHMIA